MNAVQQKRRILLIEDDATSALLIQRLLERSGPDVAVTHIWRLSEAVRQAAKISADVIITDLHLPDACDAHCIEFLLQWCPKTPVIAMSSGQSEEEIRHLLRLGAAGYLSKEQIFDVSLADVLCAAETRFRQRTMRPSNAESLQPEICLTG
ncbi:MAG: response regulator transcription factor [Planctomycetaceae bacterium]|nr:response regulator transcription factor [Planctomycetaceae bacterium]